MKDHIIYATNTGPQTHALSLWQAGREAACKQPGPRKSWNHGPCPRDPRTPACGLSPCGRHDGAAADPLPVWGRCRTSFHDTSTGPRCGTCPSALSSPPRAPKAASGVGIPAPKPASRRGRLRLVLRVRQTVWLVDWGTRSRKHAHPVPTPYHRPEAEANSFLTA